MSIDQIHTLLPSKQAHQRQCCQSSALGDTPDAPEPPLTTTTWPHMMMLLLHRIHKTMDQAAWVYAQIKQEKIAKGRDTVDN
jgi:hypothetical protein